MPPPTELIGRRVLVTGGSGFVGSRVIDALCRAGSWVLSVDQAHPRGPAPVEAGFEQCDVRSTRVAEIITSFAPEVVVHLAAQVDVAESLRRPILDMDVNVRGTITIAQAAADAGAELLVVAGSCALYGVPERLPVAEDHPMRPVTPYGVSKAAALRYVEWFTEFRGLPATSLILGNVYGPGASSGVIGRFLSDAAKRRESVLHDGGRCTRDFVHVDDVTAAILRACTVPAVGRVNVGTGVETSIAETYALVSAAAGYERDPVSGPARDGDIERMCLRNDRAIELLDWSPRITLADGITALASGTSLEVSA